MKKYLGIDIGGTYIKYGIYTKNCEKIITNKILTDLSSLENFLYSIESIIKNNDDIDGIGISIPGFVNNQTGEILDPGAISPLKNKNIKQLIKEKCNVNVDIENDANCVALAEKWAGNGKIYKNFLTITIGTGIGGGIIINNHLYKGNNFMAGEFGYMIVNGINTENCKFSTGNFIASTSKLVSDVSKLKKQDLTGEEIFQMIENEDKNVLDIYNNWIFNISLIVYNLIYSFNPDAVLIGGGVSNQSRIIKDIKKIIDKFDSRTTSFVTIDKCKFNNDSGIIGAIYTHLVNNNKL